MSARRRKQSNAMLYTLIVFVGLFIAATAAAVIYYVKAEEYRTTNESIQEEINELASPDQQSRLGAIIGEQQSGESRLGTMANYIDLTTALILGGTAEDTSAQVKTDNASDRAKDAVIRAGDYIDISDPNIMGLVPAVNELINELERTIEALGETQDDLEERNAELERAAAAQFEKEQELQDEKLELEQTVAKIQEEYEQLQADLSMSTDEEVQSIRDQMERLETERDELNSQLLRTQAMLNQTRSQMEDAMEKLAEIQPGPDREAMAYIPDGKIISIDKSSNTVTLDIGIKNRVYRGLRFTVYSRGTSITRDGRGKAEIEVYGIEQDHSTARIIEPEAAQPLLTGDIVANLIWDSDKENVFVLGGDFDIDGDGDIDDNAASRIASLIQKWGGTVKDAEMIDGSGAISIGIDTDFVILGDMPVVDVAPDEADLEIDPDAMRKYEEARQRNNRYRQIMSQAQSLWIPIFTYEKFLHFIGYSSQASEPGAFE